MTRCHTKSQCRWRITGKTWSHRRVPITSRAAAFWIDWRRCIKSSVMLQYSVLQGSSRPVMNTWTICMLISSDRISCTLAYWTYLLSKQSSKQFLFIYQRPQLIRCCQKYLLFGTRIHATHYVAWTQSIGQLWIAQWQLAVAQFSAENYSVCPVAYNAHAIFPICQRYHFTDRTNFLDFSWQFFRIDMQETHETSHELCS